MSEIQIMRAIVSIELVRDGLDHQSADTVDKGERGETVQGQAMHNLVTVLRGDLERIGWSADLPTMHTTRAALAAMAIAASDDYETVGT